MNLFLTLSATERFSFVLDALYRAVAARFAGRRLPVLVIALVCARLRRFEREVLALVTAIRAGRVRVGHGRGGRPGVARGPRVEAPGAARLPRGFAWLLVAVPYEAANYASQMRVVLQDPEMVALIGASPRLARLLRPLCRALALEPELLAPVVAPVLVLAVVAETVVEVVAVDHGDADGAREPGSAPIGFPGLAVAPNAHPSVGTRAEDHGDFGFFEPA